MAVTLATWVDQLANGSMAKLADYKTFYQIVFILTLITLIPWLVTVSAPQLIRHAWLMLTNVRDGLLCVRNDEDRC